MDTNTIIEGTLKFRDGKKWKSRWCVLRKLSPVADCVHVQLYRDSKERYNHGQTKASLSLQYFLAVQSGFTLDKESNTIAILCEDVTVIFAFDTREQLIQWQAKIAINLGEDEQFLVQISTAPPRSKLMPGPARLHVLERRFCLTDGVPPKLLGHWQIAQLRKYGVINNRFCFEGGSQCGRGEGLHVLLTDQGEAICRTFQLAAQGNTPLTRRAASSYNHARERSISSSRTEASICDKRCSDPLLLDLDSRSRSQENLCWNSRDWACEGELSDTCPRIDSMSRPRCRSCHVKLSRSSTVTCPPGTGFTWTMESYGPGRSPAGNLEYRQKTATTLRTTGDVHQSCCPPPRPPKTKMASLDGDVSLISKKPRPSPSMPAISRCACDPPRRLERDITSSTIVEMGEDYYDTPRSFKNAICDHSKRSDLNLPRSNIDCVCRCESMMNSYMTHSATFSQSFAGDCTRETGIHKSHVSRSTSYFPTSKSFCHSEGEPSSLSSDPGWQHDLHRVLDAHSSCSCYMNVKANSLCRANKCVKTVTFSELPSSASLQKPNYVNIDFAESLRFYENCKDCYNKLLDEFDEDQDRLRCSRVPARDSCGACSREYDVSSTVTVPHPNRTSPEESQGYIKMSSLVNITAKDTTTSCNHDTLRETPICVASRSKSSLCLHSASKGPRNFVLKSLSDPEIHLLPLNRKRPKIAISKIIDLIRNVRPITAQEIQRHAKKPSLPSYKTRKDDAHYHSADTLSSDTMVNTANDASLKGSFNSLCSETTNHSGVNRFMSTSQLNLSMSSLGELKSSKDIDGRVDSDIEKYKDHLRNLEIPALPLDSEYLKHDSTCFSVVRRSCTVTFKPGHNRDSSSSNDSGVSTASLRLRRTDFTEFEMPVTTSLSAKLLREYALGQAGKSSSDLSLPRRSKSINPLGELVFQFQDSSSTAKSTSALLSVVGSQEDRAMRFMDAPSTSSGTSDLSDYMDNLSISSYSSNDNPRLSRCAVTTLKPRSGKEYHKLDRSTLKPTEEGTPDDADTQET